MKYQGLLLILIVAGLVSCQREPDTGSYNDRINSFEEISTLFKDPPAQYRTTPFWVWNTKVTKELIDRDLEDYANRGFGGVFIHPRYGLITEYLSQDWFELCRYAVEKGKELGLYVWLYDENSFPSGFAGGHVPAEMPESWNQGIALEVHRQSVLEPDLGKKYKHIMRKSEEQWEDISTTTDDFIGKEGDFLLFELMMFSQTKWYAGYSYVDLLEEGVTEKFIELTMNGYEQTIGGDFGDWVPGIFTDEPNINSGIRGKVIRWTPSLYTAYEEQWGYDLRPHLISLVEETGDWKKIRHNYYAVLLQLFIDRWSKPWYDYTEKRQLKWTGHYWEHGWPNPEHGGDNMAMYAWHQVPAIDMLFNSWSDRADQFGNIRAVKELSSVANQMGRRRTLSETYGAAGWELTFEDMKRNGDWEYVLGVNLMNQHLSYMTLMGDRKHDFPQSFSFHAPYWDYYKYQTDYFGRLSLAMASGEQQNKVLVLEPTSTMWMYYNPDGENTRMYELGNQFEDFLDELEKHQVEYDLGCENIIKDHGRINQGKLQINMRQYSLLVLPPGLENIDSPTASLLEEYLASGGKVLSFVAPPEYIDGDASNQLAQMFGEFKGQCYVTDGKLGANELELLNPGIITFTEPGSVGGILLHHRRELEDGQLVLLTNSSVDENAIGSFTMDGRSVVLLDAESGEMSNYLAEKAEGNLYISFDIAPAASLLLFVSDAKLEYGEPSLESGEWTLLKASGSVRAEPVSENVLVLDYCYLSMGDLVEEENYFYTASDKIFKYHGFEDNPWVSSSQYKTEILDRDTFSVNQSGFRVDFPFTVGESVDPEGMRAVVERPGLYEVQLNGTVIEPEADEWWLDPEFGIFQIGEIVIPGVNRISLIANPMTVHCELEPVFVVGDFSLHQQESGWLVSPGTEISTGSWREQGMPFYHDAVVYTKLYTIQNKTGQYKILLDSWNGTVAAVRINGYDAGIIYRKPFEMDISKYIKVGDNSVSVEVVGSLKNILGPHHNVTRRGVVTPWSFKYAPEIQVPGNEYDLLDYGLFGDFHLLSGTTP